MGRRRAATREAYRGNDWQVDKLQEELSGSPAAAAQEAEVPQAAANERTRPKRNVVLADVDPWTIARGGVGRRVERYPFRPMQHRLQKLAVQNGASFEFIDDKRNMFYFTHTQVSRRNGANRPGYLMGELVDRADMLDWNLAQAYVNLQVGEEGLPLRVDSGGQSELYRISARLACVAEVLRPEHDSTRDAFDLFEQDFDPSVLIGQMRNTDYYTACTLAEEVGKAFVNRQIQAGPLTVLPL